MSIADIPMFSDLDKKFHKELHESIYIKHYTKGSIVFYEGDESNYLNILLEGTVRLYKTSPKGSEINIIRMVAPNTIGEYGCFEDEPFPVTCQFVSDGIMGRLHFDKVYQYLDNKEFSLGFIKSLSSKIVLLSSLVHKEMILSSEAKVADLIIEKPTLFKCLKNNEIASILNLTPETFSRILSKLKKEKIIIFRKHQLKILNREALCMIVDTNSVKECRNCIDVFNKKIELMRELN